MKYLWYITCFFLGRLSVNWWKNRYLEKEKEYLENERATLIEYHEELEKIENSLIQKDREIRKKWQSMVDDFAEYNAYIRRENGEYTNKWSDWDDVYFQSWNSAEK